MAHRNSVPNSDGAERARGAPGMPPPLLDGLGLTHQRDVAGCGFVPAGCNANEGLVNLLAGQPHGIEVGAMRRALRALRHVTAPEPRFYPAHRLHVQCTSASAIFRSVM